jgi:hypothetical protein
MDSPPLESFVGYANGSGFCPQRSGYCFFIEPDARFACTGSIFSEHGKCQRDNVAL